MIDVVNGPLAWARLLTLAALIPLQSTAAVAAATDRSPHDVPITITGCTIDEQNAMESAKLGIRDSSAAGLTIAYTNDRDVVAREIHFAVRIGGDRLMLVDRGSFAPHAKIRHEFDKFTATYTGGLPDCRVTAVTFADGNRWDAAANDPALPGAR